MATLLKSNPEDFFPVAVDADTRDSVWISKKIKQTVWKYGKIALLIDDQVDATSRVARELYAADALPDWWLVGRSMRCASQALKAFSEIFIPLRFPKVRGLAIIDRYLPVTCNARDKRPIAWDQVPDDLQDDSKWRKELVKIFEVLSKADLKGDELPYELKFVTSYPYARRRQPKQREGASPGEIVEALVTWKTRSIELLPQYRRKISEKSDWVCLLRYGPEFDAPVVTESPEDGLLEPDELETAKWKAKAWKSCLTALADQMFLRIADQQNESGRSFPVILFTGAGASLAQGTYGAGMPETWNLLARACSELDGKESQQPEHDDRWPSPVITSCTCNRRETLSDKLRLRWPEQGNATPVEWLRSKNKEKSIRELDWRLEELFDIDKHKEPRQLEEFRGFHRAFRDALYRCDHGFAYQHWLMARMPWSAILTTNFDGFHERSAMSAAQIPWLDADTRNRCLQLGSIAPDWPRHSRNHFAVNLIESAGRILDESLHKEVMAVLEKQKLEPEKREHALFKIYGSLYSPSGDIALSLEEIRGSQDRFYAALSETLGDAEKGALIVIGHSMRDDFINEVLAKPEILKQLERMQILWVDPAAFDRCSSSSVESHWERQVAERRRALDIQIAEDNKKTSPKRGGKASVYSGPLPAKALEFLQDLWLLLQTRVPS